jgi:hypothetical protein
MSKSGVAGYVARSDSRGAQGINAFTRGMQSVNRRRGARDLGELLV